MLKLSLKPGEYITLGDNIKIIFSGGSANNIHLLVDAPREINVARNSAGKDKKPSPYYKEKGISKTAQREIAEILMREKRNQSHVSGRISGSVILKNCVILPAPSISAASYRSGDIEESPASQRTIV